MKTKRKVHDYLNGDDPLNSIPKTSRWRMKRQLQKSEEASTLKESPDRPRVASNAIEAVAAGVVSHILPPACICPEEVFTATTDNQEGHACMSNPVLLDETDDTPEFQPLAYTDRMSAETIPSDSTTNSQTAFDDDYTDDDFWWKADDENCVWFDAMEDVESEENTKSDKIDGDNPIYAGAKITAAESATLILSFVLRHHLNGECLSDLLTLISLHCLTTNVLHMSLHRFKSFFSTLKSPLVFHTYCTKCEFLVKPHADKCTVCNNDFSNKSNSSYFVEIPLVTQLQEFFRRKDFHRKLKHHHTSKTNHTTISDIYDGAVYKRHSKPGSFLHNSDNISLMWYTDGVPLFKSSKVSIWPLFLAINELPYQDRFKQENLLFAGLWFGKSKPTMAYFLKPFHDTLSTFFHTGYKLFCEHCSQLLTVKGMLMCGTCDLPAKCMVLNMNQFNGQYGCAKCVQEGSVIKVGKGHARTFPFNEEEIDGPKRTHDNFIQHGEEALVNSKHCYGVKGPTWWTNCCPDIINGTAIDYMHCVLLGVIRKLLVLWFNPKYSGKAFSASNLVSVADKKLSAIKPPYFVKRHPRDIKEQAKYWKASECRTWLFFYSVPVLFGILKKEFFQHYLLLVEAIYILNLDTVSIQDLNHAENMLIKFCGIYASLYGSEHMSANIHQLIHLPDTVRQLGPLWVYSCFSFESVNGKLISLFHGTQNPVVQIANAISTMLKLPALSHHIKEESAAEMFYQKLTGVNKHFKVTETISDGAFIIGNKKLTVIELKYLHAISQCVHFAIDKCYLFKRVLLHGILYHSVSYHTYSRNSCTVVYNEHDKINCGRVLFYVKVYPICQCRYSECFCRASYIAIVQKITKDAVSPFVGGDRIQAQLKHIYTGTLLNDFVAIKIADIAGLGVCVEITPERLCITLPPNNVEGD